MSIVAALYLHLQSLVEIGENGNWLPTLSFEAALEVRYHSRATPQEHI
jgi:hypothetical protein